MKVNYIFTVFLSFIFFTAVNAQGMSESGSLGVGFASAYPGYGLSAKYNFTETHAAQLIVGGASYGFGSGSFAISGRYLYNFEEGGSGFVYKPYLYGQVGYYSVEFDFGFLGSESFNTVSFGVGGGVEFSFDNFVDGLAFSGEVGYVGGSFDNAIGSGYAGFAYGAGIHYYFIL
jgi:hypothetical protein